MNRRGVPARRGPAPGRPQNLRPGDPVRHVDLAESHRNLGGHRLAIGCCRTALRLRPDYPEALEHDRPEAAPVERRDHEGALEQFRRAVKLRPGFSPAHTNAGDVVLRGIGEADQALPHLQRAVELEPDSALTRTNLGLALLEGGRAGESLEHFQQAARLGPDLAVAHHNLGNALRLLGRNAEARDSYREAIRLDPHLGLSYLHIAMICRQEGELDDALDWCGRALATEPQRTPNSGRNGPSCIAIAASRTGSPRVDAASRTSRTPASPTSATVEPGGSRRRYRPTRTSSPTSSSRDRCRARTGRASRRRTSTPARSIGSRIPLSWRVRMVGRSARRARSRSRGLDRTPGRDRPAVPRGRAGRALLPHFLEAARLRPDAAIAHHNVGNALRILGRTSEARACYLEAIRLNPDFARSYLHVGTTLVLEGSLDDAVKWFKIVVEMEPDNPDFWEELAGVHHSSGTRPTGRSSAGGGSSSSPRRTRRRPASVSAGPFRRTAAPARRSSNI